MPAFTAAQSAFASSICKCRLSFLLSVGRRQFVSFDSAQKASSVLGCEGEELHTAVFKHHLRQLLQRATTGGSRERTAAEAEEGETPGFHFSLIHLFYICFCIDV